MSYLHIWSIELGPIYFWSLDYLIQRATIFSQLVPNLTGITWRSRNINRTKPKSPKSTSPVCTYHINIRVPKSTDKHGGLPKLEIFLLGGSKSQNYKPKWNWPVSSGTKSVVYSLIFVEPRKSYQLICRLLAPNTLKTNTR